MTEQTYELARTLYVEWLKGAQGLGSEPENYRREMFRIGAGIAIEAAEEFANACEAEDNAHL